MGDVINPGKFEDFVWLQQEAEAYADLDRPYAPVYESLRNLGLRTLEPYRHKLVEITEVPDLPEYEERPIRKFIAAPNLERDRLDEWTSGGYKGRYDIGTGTCCLPATIFKYRKSVRGTVIGIDPENSSLVVKPRRFGTYTRFWTRMVGKDGEPLVDLRFLDEES